MSSDVKKERDSNFELCRLACMFYIVFYHLIIHVPGLYQEVGWARPLRTICHIGVVVFVMISGYYGIRRSWKGFLKIALTVSFYNLLGLLIAHFCFAQPFDPKQLLTVVFPISQGKYWFITSYVILFLLAPYINTVLDNLGRKEFWIFLAIMAVLVFYLGGIHQLKAADGRGILAFVLSYGIGRFIRRFYPDGLKGVPMMGRYPWLAYLLFCTVIYVLVAFAPSTVSKGVNFLFFGYNEIGLYIMAVLFFLAFQGIRIKSRVVNYLAVSVLAIYLLHENSFLNELVYYSTYERWSAICGNAWGQLLFHSLFALGIVITSIAIDQLRRYLFKLCKM